VTQELVLREYQDADFQHLVLAMEFLQDHVVSKDNFCLNVKNEWYWIAYAEKSLKRVSQESGKIFLAYLGETFLGCILWVIEEWVGKDDKNPLQDVIIWKTGEVVELIVLPASR